MIDSRDTYISLLLTASRIAFGTVLDASKASFPSFSATAPDLLIPLCISVSSSKIKKEIDTHI
jgi:hypothetical protein